MKLRSSYVVIVAETGIVLMLWQALRDATHGLQHMASVYADHHCTDLPVYAAPSLLFEQHPPVFPQQVFPAPEQDPALTRNPHTLGRP